MKDSHSIDLEAMRHSAAHVLAAASTKLKADTQLGVGPATADGFYHDIDVKERYTENDLAALQAEMEKIKAMNLPITQREVSKDEARKLFAHDQYKLELIDELPDDTVGVSDMGDGFFVTLCKGGHVHSTNEIGSFKLTRLAGVYWRGDSERQQLQRIYGILFPTHEELEVYEQKLEEAKKRDHRKLGKELDLFTFSPLVGPGLPLFTPRGTVIRRELENFVQSIQEPLGFERVTIPHITKAELYKVSGHWDKFKDDLFHVKGKSEDAFVMKPMNCPHHTQIFASRPRSYKELPIRFSEVTAVYRDEQAGELQGLTRVRSITQDDAHVFCRADQIESEISTLLDAYDAFHTAFGFEMSIRLSLRDPAKQENYLGSDEIWQRAEGALRDALTAKGKEFFEGVGEAAFYGPKIDFIAKDSLGREWQLSTIQLDFNMPGRFELSYTDEKGQAQTPVMIHRAMMGAVERFMAIILEHYAGALPLWLSPTQVKILPISDEQVSFAKEVLDQLKQVGIRAETDESSESIGKKIRAAETMKVPVMLVIGKREVENKEVTVRLHGNKEQFTSNPENLISSLQEAATKRQDLAVK